MSTKIERDEKVTEILNMLYNDACNETIVIDDSNYKNSLEKLFNTTAWGFREILLVVIVAMYLDDNFSASTGLYDCNPRAIFEGPIKEFLIEKNIPHRKSGPLNIAKATVGLDATWAAQRRPAAIANEVVKLVQYIENDNSDAKTKKYNVGVSLLRRLIACSQQLEALAVEIEPSADPERLFKLCYELITKAPDAGNTPQKISAFLLKSYHMYFFDNIFVSGEEDRASVTSTTSKKPGDINEENPEGFVRKVYEVTVKPFDLSRIRDSYDCVKRYNEENDSNIQEIIVICRPQDCPDEMIKSGLHGYIGSYSYNDIIYYYWDIFEWIANTLQRMNEEGRRGFYMKLNSYINEINTAEKVKELWHKLHI